MTDSTGFLNGCIRSLGKGQDFVAFGHHSDFAWGVVLDGHGTDHFMTLVKTIDFGEVMSAVDPFASILSTLEANYDKYPQHKSSGSTLVMMRAYTNKVETISVGDSTACVFLNGVLTYKSPKHTSKNENEILRLKNRKVYFERMTSPVGHVVSRTKMVAHFPDYTLFENGTRLACTQSLGHNGITGYQPEVNTVYFSSEDDHVRCLLFSDGFDDMMVQTDEEEGALDKQQDETDMQTMTALELASKAETRWKQSWQYHWNPKNPSTFEHCVYPDGAADDIGIVVWDNKVGV
jgi:serine/threonine protein phosphatase PrpC